MTKYKKTAIGFQRTDSRPLEANTYFESMSEAGPYISLNPTSYPGQRVFVRNSYTGEYDEYQNVDNRPVRVHEVRTISVFDLLKLPDAPSGSSFGNCFGVASGVELHKRLQGVMVIVDTSDDETTTSISCKYTSSTTTGTLNVSFIKSGITFVYDVQFDVSESGGLSHFAFKRIQAVKEANVYFKDRPSALEYAKNNPATFNGQRIYFKNESGDYEERQVYEGVLLRPLSTGNGCTIVDRLSSFLPFRASINSSVLLPESGDVYLGIGNYQAKWNSDNGGQFEHHGGGVGTSSFDYSTGVLTVNIPLEIGKEYYIRSTFHNTFSIKGFYASGAFDYISRGGYPYSVSIYESNKYKRIEFKAEIQTIEENWTGTYRGGKLDIYEYIKKRGLEYTSYSIYRYAGKGNWIYSGKVTHENKVFARQSNVLVYKTLGGDFTVEYPPKPYTGVDIRSIVKIRKSDFKHEEYPDAKYNGFVRIPEELPMNIGIFTYRRKRINNYSKVDGERSSFLVRVSKYHFYRDISAMFSGDYNEFIANLLQTCKQRNRGGRLEYSYYCKFYLSFYYSKMSKHNSDVVHRYPVGNKIHFVAYNTPTEYKIRCFPT